MGIYFYMKVSLRTSGRQPLGAFRMPHPVLISPSASETQALFSTQPRGRPRQGPIKGRSSLREFLLSIGVGFHMESLIETICGLA